MYTIIKLRVKREIDNQKHLKILKLKGTLITEGYTEIIHISDESEDFYLNTFSISQDNKKKAEDFVMDYISNHSLADTVTII